MSCFFLLSAGAQNLPARFGVANGLEASSNTTNVRPHEFLDHTTIGTLRTCQNLTSTPPRYPPSTPRGKPRYARRETSCLKMKTMLATGDKLWTIGAARCGAAP